MLRKVFDWFKPAPIKKAAIIDGDQDVVKTLAAYGQYVAGTGTEAYFVRMKQETHNVPRRLTQCARKYPELEYIYLTGYRAGKEVVDKYIAGMIQKMVADGYQHITVISSDYDFIDIFKMAVMIEPKAAELTFRLIVPEPQGIVAETPCQIANIEIVKMGKRK